MKTIVRWDGHVQDWPVDWSTGTTDEAFVVVQAQDRMSKLSGLRKMRDPLVEELGQAQSESRPWTWDVDTWDNGMQWAGGMTWLYGLQESSGSTRAGDVSGIPGRPRLTLTQSGSGGEFAFGTAGSMPEGTAATFTPASAGNGLTLGNTTAQSYVGGEFSLWAQFEWHATSSSAQLVQLGTSPGATVTIGLTTTTVTATLSSPEGGSATATKTIATNDRAAHFVLLSRDVDGTARLYVDLESAATATPPVDMGTVQGITIGHTLSAAAVQVAWVGMSATGTTAARAAELATLATGAAERSDLRITRWMRWLGVEGDLTAETGRSDVGYIATGGQSLLDCVAEVAKVEGGLLLPTPNIGGGFSFHSRGHRYNPATRLVIDVGDVDPTSLVAVRDPARLLNDYTVSRPRGATYRAVNQESADEHGTRPDTATIYAATDDDLVGAADWAVGRRGQLATYFRTIRLDLLTLPEDVVGPAMGLEVGDLIAVSGLPLQAPAATIDLFVEGLDDEITDRSWWLTIATSPAVWHQVWTWDSNSWDDGVVWDY